MQEIRDLAECDLRLPGNSPNAYRTYSGQHEVLPRIVAVADEHFVGVSDLAVATSSSLFLSLPTRRTAAVRFRLGVSGSFVRTSHVFAVAGPADVN